MGATLTTSHFLLKVIFLMRHYGKLLGGVAWYQIPNKKAKLYSRYLTKCVLYRILLHLHICAVSKMGGPSGPMGIKFRWSRLNLRNAVFQGCHHPIKAKFRVFNIFLVFYFQPQNITFNLLPMHMERYTIINIHSKPHSHLQQSLLQNIHFIISLSHNLKFASETRDCTTIL